MQLEIVGIPKSAVVSLRVHRRLGTALAPAQGAVRGCRVAFTDENGPKGGVDTRCTIDLRLVRRAPIHVVGRASSRALALREALERLRRRVRESVGASRAAARRPRKYFAARVQAASSA